MHILRIGLFASNRSSLKQKSGFKALLTVLLLPSVIHAQLIDSYQNPPGIKWKKIDTPHFEIVFPQELSDEGRRVANTLETLYVPLNKTLDANRKRFSLFLTNQGAYANGFVTLAPRKSVWFHQPVQGNFTGSGEWYNLLAAHEGRHMVQFDKMNAGFTRFAGWLTGETGVLGLSMFSVPIWWWEGDAVGMETALTRSGRGRIPEFCMGIRTLLLNNVRYSYPKAFLGSYRDWTPNWYELGYPLVSHVKQKYGPSVWGRVIKRTSRWSFWPYAFSNALKKETGKSVPKLYEETMTELEGAWKKQLPDSMFPAYRTLNHKPSAWTKYRFPQYQDDSTVIAQKQGFDTPWSLVMLDGNGNEKTLKQLSLLEPGGTRGSVAAGKTVWDEAVPDIRWGARSFSSIMIFDIQTGETRSIVNKSRYFNPSLSPEGKCVAAVEFGTDRICALVILDAETGRFIKRIPSPDNALLQSPSWSKDGRRIVFTFQQYKGKGIAVLDVDYGEIREALPPAWDGISNPVLWDRYVLFSSPKSGIDNIHAVDLAAGTEYQATSVPYGAFTPQVSPDGKKLLFANYSPNGMDVCETDFDPSTWTRSDSTAVDAVGYAETLKAQEGGPMLDEAMISKTTHLVQDYKPFFHLLNVHSWLPVSSSHEFGLLLRSNDKLNTTSLAFGPVIDLNENRVRLEASGAYAGFFPMIDFTLSRGSRGAEYVDRTGRTWLDSWNETSAGLGLNIPLNLSRGVYDTQFRAGLGASFTRVSDKSINAWGEQFNGTLIPFHYRIEFSRLRDGAIRDVAPRLGQVLTAEYRHTPFKSDYRGSQFFSWAALYLPGLAKHHSILFRAAWEEQKPENYLFATTFLFSRGYGSVFHEKFAHASASYAFPLFCPDFALGSLVYMKRVKGRLFYDHTLGMDDGAETLYRSAGVEIGFETCFFNLPLPLDLGIRWVHRVEDNENRIEVLFGFDMPSS
jgi:hypothetical protein